MKLKIRTQAPKKREYVNMTEAAEILGVCYRTLRQAMDNGEIPYQKISAKKYLLRIDALESLATRKDG